MLRLITSPLDGMFYLFPQAFLSKFLSLLPFERLEYGGLTLHFRGVSHSFQGMQDGPQADLKINRLFRFLWLIKTQGELGFAQAYIEKTIDTPSLYLLLKLGLLNAGALKTILSERPISLWHL